MVANSSEHMPMIESIGTEAETLATPVGTNSIAKDTEHAPLRTSRGKIIDDISVLTSTTDSEPTESLLQKIPEITQKALTTAVDIPNEALHSKEFNNVYDQVQAGIAFIPTLKPLTNLNDKLVGTLRNELGAASLSFHGSTKDMMKEEMEEYKLRNRRQPLKAPDPVPSNLQPVSTEESSDVDFLKFRGVIGEILESKDFLMNMGLAFFMQRKQPLNLTAANNTSYKQCTVFPTFPYMLHLQDFYFEFPKKKSTSVSYAGVELSKTYNATEGGNTFGFNMFMDEDLLLYTEFNKMIGTYFTKSGQQQIYSQAALPTNTYIDLYVITPAGNGAGESIQDLTKERFVDLFVLESIKMVKTAGPLKFAHKGGTTFSSKVTGGCTRVSLVTDLLLSKL